jgi:hypothetical protein
VVYIVVYSVCRCTKRFSDKVLDIAEVVTDRLFRTRTSDHDLLKTFIGFFATVEPILGVLGLIIGNRASSKIAYRYTKRTALRLDKS